MCPHWAWQEATSYVGRATVERAFSWRFPLGACRALWIIIRLDFTLLWFKSYCRFSFRTGWTLLRKLKSRFEVSSLGCFDVARWQCLRGVLCELVIRTQMRMARRVVQRRIGSWNSVWRFALAPRGPILVVTTQKLKWLWQVTCSLPVHRCEMEFNQVLLHLPLNHLKFQT